MTYENEKLAQDTPGVCPCCGEGTYRGMLPGAVSSCGECGWNTDERYLQSCEAAQKQLDLRLWMDAIAKMREMFLESLDNEEGRL